VDGGNDTRNITFSYRTKSVNNSNGRTSILSRWLNQVEPASGYSTGGAEKTLAGRGQFTALIELSFQLINHPRAG
jgi:hypothetical protein